MAVKAVFQKSRTGIKGGCHAEKKINFLIHGQSTAHSIVFTLFGPLVSAKEKGLFFALIASFRLQRKKGVVLT